MQFGSEGGLEATSSRILQSWLVHREPSPQDLIDPERVVVGYDLALIAARAVSEAPTVRIVIENKMSDS
jgi:hypothetical protein